MILEMHRRTNYGQIIDKMQMQILTNMQGKAVKNLTKKNIDIFMSRYCCK